VPEERRPAVCPHRDRNETGRELDDWAEELYCPVDAVGTTETDLTAVPYYAWDNREDGPMQVWIRDG